MSSGVFQSLVSGFTQARTQDGFMLACAQARGRLGTGVDKPHAPPRSAAATGRGGALTDLPLSQMSRGTAIGGL